MKLPGVTRIFQLFDTYLDTLRHGCDLSSFWMSCIDMIEIVLGLLRASREGNWLLHLAMVKEMIPWCFAYDNQNYAKYMPVYYRQMSRLETDHPDVYEHCMNACFSTQMSDTNPFGRIPIDQTIEETANKDTQTPGGTKGFSLKPGAISRFYLTAEYRSTCLRNLRKMTHAQPSSTCAIHVDLEPARIRRDEQDVEAIISLLENNWINPFVEQHDLIHLSTGIVASTEVKQDLLAARQKGEAAYTSFVAERIDGEEAATAFYARLPKLQLKTFGSMTKSKRTTVSNKEVTLKADRKLFGHMVLVASSRNLDMQEVLQHPLGPLPWALANSDGTMKKTNKAALARNLENMTSPTDTIPSPSVCIVDGMALIHKLNGDTKTFAEVANVIFVSALHSGSGSDRIDIVFDVYNDISIKNAERQSRMSDTGIVFSGIVAGHKIQQWRRLLRCSVSKTALTKFLVEEWMKQTYLKRLGSIEMYITCQGQCFKLTKDGTSTCEELTTSQEEADSRMLLHAKHASQYFNTVIIVSEDTDVLILCLAFSSNIGQIFIRCGTGSRIRYIDVSKLSSSLGSDVCYALLGLHAFTGCDSVSAFAGRGKVSALKLIMRKDDLRETMGFVGQHWEMSTELFTRIKKFTCQMYSARTTTCSVNDLRFQLFRAKKGDIESGQLPPCEDCLYLHASRANYQAALWRKSLEPTPVIPSPDGHGWNMDEGNLEIKWMTGAPAPDVVLEFLACRCKRACKLPDCQCLANGLKCTPACILQSCQNFADEDDQLDSNSDDEDITENADED